MNKAQFKLAKSNWLLTKTELDKLFDEYERNDPYQEKDFCVVVALVEAKKIVKLIDSKIGFQQINPFWWQALKKEVGVE